MKDFSGQTGLVEVQDTCTDVLADLFWIHPQLSLLEASYVNENHVKFSKMFKATVN